MRSMENPHAGQGPVLLDVGGDIGALLVTMPASLEGSEIEIRPQPVTGDADHGHPPDALDHTDHTHLTHVEVLPRPTPAGFVTCAVFPELVKGRYELYERPSGPVRLRVSVTGGRVTQASWPITGTPGGSA